MLIEVIIQNSVLYVSIFRIAANYLHVVLNFPHSIKEISKRDALKLGQIHHNISKQNTRQISVKMRS